MRFKVDENLPVDVAALLASAGHDATTVHSEGLCGAAGPQVAQVCNSEARVVVTLDLDFADIRDRALRLREGVIVIRAGVQEREHVIGIVRKVISFLDHEPLRGNVWIVDESSIRVRELDDVRD